eukprot:TRINITY_DN19239_c0_g1_i2.p1 TRINITY_DN19239_c0_g1~~TRINITY_DN19239_c0_g1_i2.p1  ORF type:complete len:411 (+),score=42.48 TRINITY_DN19239_c0_g1_i2:234-1466(+)
MPTPSWIPLLATLALTLLLPVPASSSGASTGAAALRTAGFNCFARRDREVWTAGPVSLHLSGVNEQECREACASSQTALFVPEEENCYCHQGVATRPLSCSTQHPFCNSTSSGSNCSATSASQNLTTCVSFVRRWCHGYRGFALYGHQQPDAGDLGPSEFTRRASAPQNRVGGPQDSPWLLNSDPHPLTQCGFSKLQPTSCRGFVAGDTQCPLTQLSTPSGWCGSAPDCPIAHGLVCAGRGRCNSQGLCDCISGSFGPACELRHCPGRAVMDPPATAPEEHVSLVECSASGRCDHGTGLCQCDLGFHGAGCEWRRCPVAAGRECGGQGECTVYGECECNAGFGGADCSTRFCGAGIALEAARSPGSTKTLGHACSGRGRCTTLGACDCDRGYWGEWCEKGDGQAVLVDMA